MSVVQRIAATAGLICVAQTADASAPAAWGELNRKASVACLKAVDLVDAKVHGAPVDFDEAVLFIVEGRHAQAHMNNAPVTRYCLYGKSTARTHVSEMPGAALSPTKASAPVPVTGKTCWSETLSTPLKWPRRLGTPCTVRNDLGDPTPGVVRK